MNTVTIVGSINLDQTIRVKHMPLPGQTIQTSEIFSAGGGKGSNQAVAAKRSGAETHFIGAVGSDSAGQTMSSLLEKEGIDIANVMVLESAKTGQAYIVVDDAGENSIMIHGGANQSVMIDGDAIHTIKESDFVISQFENNLDATQQAFEVARKHGVRTILNPAPALDQIPAELLAVTDVIIPNETEAEAICGMPVQDADGLIAAATKLHELGVELAIITLGKRGAYYHFADGRSGTVPAFPVKAVDTTAAGDTFIGAMASQLTRNFSNMEDAIRYGNKASSLTVQRYGAMPSIPYADEIME